MATAEKIPWEQMPMTAEECAMLWCISPEHFLATVACLPEFPVRVTKKPASWLAGEVIEYRNANRVGQPKNRRRRRSTT